jgi:hypothetical protein
MQHLRQEQIYDPVTAEQQKQQPWEGHLNSHQKEANTIFNLRKYTMLDNLVDTATLNNGMGAVQVDLG